MKFKRWKVASVNKENARKLQSELNISYFLGIMLDVRGIDTVEKAREFLSDDYISAFENPFTLKDMDKAVARINKAIEDGEVISIFGDYDADGVTATTVLYTYLEYVGANVSYYIPDREKEGYGMNKNAVKALADKGVNLIITVDNGVSSIEEIDYANSLGVDVVVTDHHRPRDILPNAVAVVNPHRKDCPSKFKELAGVGVAFKLLCALEGEYADIEGLLDLYSELVAIGTVGDVVSLTGENRALVKAGIKFMPQTENLGLHALMSNASVEKDNISISDIAFGIVPRINATGRMEHAKMAVDLLTCNDYDDAESLAGRVSMSNNTRKACETEILDKVYAQLRKEPERLNQQILIIEGENWHHGVIGIVASRLLDKYGKPCLVISITGDMAKGSGRSIEGFSLFENIHKNGELLTRYGGHPMAAGFSLKTENIPAFKEALYKCAAECNEPLVQTVKMDCKLKPEALTVEIPNRLKILEPFGTDNPSPLFGLFEMTIKTITPVGNGKHIKLTMEKNGSTVSCMLFGVTEEEFSYNTGDIVDAAVQLSSKEFRGEDTLTVSIKELRISNLDYEIIIQDYHSYEKYKRNARLMPDDLMRLTPTREEFISVYTTLKEHGGWNGHMLSLYKLVGDKVRYGRFLVILQALRELKLISCRQQSERIQVGINKTQGKVQLDKAPILIKLSEEAK